MSDLIFDDFSGTSLDAAWTRQGIVSGDETWNLPGLTTTGIAAADMYLRAAPAGTQWTVEVFLSKGSDTQNRMIGPAILSSGGTGPGVTFYGTPSGFLYAPMSGYGYGGSFTNDDSSLSRTAMTGFRLRRDGTNYYTSYSTDGGSTWSTESSAHSNAATITQVGFGCWSNGAGATTIAVTSFRVFPPFSPDATVTPPAATATASAPVSVVSAASSVAPPAATALASAPAPVVSNATNATVAPPAATATASAPAPVITQTIPAGTDTTNFLNGRNRRARASVTVIRPIGTAPSNLAPRHDKAVPLPPPTLVNGRVT